jgi:hypothetical protein
LPADGRNHRKTHKTEFNRRMGRWICGCGWKGEPIGKKRPRRNPGDGQKSEGAADELLTHCIVCNYESTLGFDVCPKCRSEGMAVLVLKKA